MVIHLHTARALWSWDRATGQGHDAVHALQMLSGGETQKERLKVMHERILQRTVPIEEVGSSAQMSL